MQGQFTFTVSTLRNLPLFGLLHKAGWPVKAGGHVPFAPWRRPPVEHACQQPCSRTTSKPGLQALMRWSNNGHKWSTPANPPSMPLGIPHTCQGPMPQTMINPECVACVFFLNHGWTKMSLCKPGAPPPAPGPPTERSVRRRGRAGRRGGDGGVVHPLDQKKSEEEG